MFRHHTFVQSISPPEQRIADLCAKVIACPQDSEDFKLAIHELTAALREHLETTRDKVADLAMSVADPRPDSQAAD